MQSSRYSSPAFVSPDLASAIVLFMCRWVLLFISEPVDKIRPGLHHLASLREEGCPVVGSLVWVTDGVAQLVLDPVLPVAEVLDQQGPRGRPEAVDRGLVLVDSDLPECLRSELGRMWSSGR